MKMLDEKKKMMGKKMSMALKSPKHFGKKGHESLNSPRRGRDNDIMEGKNEKELG